MFPILEILSRSGDNADKHERNFMRSNTPILAFIGDSITEGWGLNNYLQERYTTLLQDRFPQYEFLNFGSSGATLQSQFDTGYEHTLAFLASQKAAIDKAFLFLGANDVWYWTSEKTFKEEYERLIDRYKKSDVILITPLQMNTGSYEEHKLEQIRKLILEIGKERDLPVIDLYTLSKKDWLSFDGVHPSPSGQKHIADAITSWIGEHPQFF